MVAMAPNRPLKNADSVCGTGFQPVKTGVAPASSRCEHGLQARATLQAAKHERPALELPADWEAIGRFVREGTFAAVASHFEALAALLTSMQSWDPGTPGSGGGRS